MRINPNMTRLAALVVFCGMAAPYTAVAEDVAETVPASELMVLTGLDVAFDQFGPQIAAVAQDPQLSRDSRFVEAWEAAVSSTFDAQAMMSALRDILATREVSLADQQAMAEFYASDLGKKVHELESAVAMLPPDAAMAAIEGGGRLYATMPSGRLAQYDRLWGTMRDGSLVLGTEMMRPVLRGIAIMMGADPTTSPCRCDLDTAIDAMMPPTLFAMEQQERARLAFVYQGLSDEEFEAYLAFLEGPAGTNFSIVATDAMADVIRAEMQRFVAALEQRRPDISAVNYQAVRYCGVGPGPAHGVAVLDALADLSQNGSKQS